MFSDNGRKKSKPDMVGQKDGEGVLVDRKNSSPKRIILIKRDNTKVLEFFRQEAGTEVKKN